MTRARRHAPETLPERLTPAMNAFAGPPDETPPQIYGPYLRARSVQPGGAERTRPPMRA